MPEVTMVVVASGVSGLTVVFARRKLQTPAKAIASPTMPKIRANAECHGSAIVNGEYAEASHIKAPNRNTTATGGILSSSVLNMRVGNIYG